MTLYVDHDALERISRSMTSAGEHLDSAGDSAPTAVDGGLGTPALLGILAHLADNAGQLVIAAKATGAAVGQANTNYRELDEATADSHSQTVWTR
jgi:hypothetical protein